MRKIITKLNSPYIKDIFTSFTGTSLSQAITISMAPILTRIYSPDDYGLLAIYIGITAILFVFVTLQYSQTILLTKDKLEEDNVVFLCYIITIFYTILTALFICIFYFFQFDFFKNARLGFWLFSIPISVLLFGLSDTHSRILNKHKKYKSISYSLIITSIITVTASLSLGLILKNYQGLLIGFILGQFSRLFFLVLFSKKIQLDKNHITLNEIKKIIIKFKKFPIYSIPTEFLLNWTIQLPIFFLNYNFNTSAVGNFNYGRRMVGLPINLITGAIGRVFAQKAAEEYRNKSECKKTFINTLKMIALPILPFFIILIIFAPEIFEFVFGSRWVTAGEYVQILVPMFYLKAIVSPLSYMYIIKNKQDEDMIIHIFAFLFTALSFYVGYMLESNVVTILYLFSFSYCLIYIYTLIRSYQFSTLKND